MQRQLVAQCYCMAKTHVHTSTVCKDISADTPPLSCGDSQPAMMCCIGQLTQNVLMLMLCCLPACQVEDLLREAMVLKEALDQAVSSSVLEKLLPKRYKQYQKGISQRS